MPGPWEAYQQPQQAAGPWSAYAEPAPTYGKGASESRIGHHLETTPIKVVPSLVDLAASPITGLLHLPAAISEWAKGDRGNAQNYPPGIMGSNPLSDAFGSAVAALATAKGTPAPSINPEFMPPPPPSASGTIPGAVAAPTSTGAPPLVTLSDLFRFPLSPRKTLGRIVEKGIERYTTEPAKARGSPSPTWKPTPMPEPPAPKPTASPTWNRGTTSSAIPSVEEAPRPALKPENQSIVDKVLAEQKRETIPPPPSDNPIKPSELREPTTEAELHYSTHAVAKDLWGKSPHEPLRQLIEERYGKNRTQAFKNVPEGKTPLSKPERTDLLRFLLKQMPPPPK